MRQKLELLIDLGMWETNFQIRLFEEAGIELYKEVLEKKLVEKYKDDKIYYRMGRLLSPLLAHAKTGV